MLKFLGRSRLDRNHPALALVVGHPDLIKRQHEVARHSRVLQRVIRTGLSAWKLGSLLRG